MMLQIKALDDNRTIAATSTTSFSNTFDWAREEVAIEYGCEIDDVDCIDTEEYFDVMTARGAPVARMVRVQS